MTGGRAPSRKTTDDIFKGKKALGAVRPAPRPSRRPATRIICPASSANEAAIKAKGVETIAMTSGQRHPFVLSAGPRPRAAKARSASWPTAMPISPRRTGLYFDASANGLGLRSKRYSMLVKDCVLKTLNIEGFALGKADLSGGAGAAGATLILSSPGLSR